MKLKIRNPKAHKRHRRHLSIRRKIAGTEAQPRLSVFRSKLHIYAQIIDDANGSTLVAASSLGVKVPEGKKEPAADDKKGGKKKDKEKKGGEKKGKGKKAASTYKIRQAQEVGRLIAEAAKEKGVTRIKFDRGGYLYHGRVAALAEAARESGLKF